MKGSLFLRFALWRNQVQLFMNRIETCLLECSRELVHLSLCPFAVSYGISVSLNVSNKRFKIDGVIASRGSTRVRDNKMERRLSFE